MAPWLAVSLLAVFLAAGNTSIQASSGHPLLRHFVALKFKETTTKEQVHEIEEAFQSLKSKIPQVISIEWGTNISPEQLLFVPPGGKIPQPNAKPLGDSWYAYHYD
jgi:hypothetical protein